MDNKSNVNENDEVITGVTSSGFQYTLNKEDLDNYELLEILAEIDAGNEQLYPKMITMFLGEDQKECLKEHLRDKNGKISTVAMFNEVSEIFSQAKTVKN